MNYHHLPPDLALLLTLSVSNYPCLEQISIVFKDVRAIEIRLYLTAWLFVIQLLTWRLTVQSLVKSPLYEQCGLELR